MGPELGMSTSGVRAHGWVEVDRVATRYQGIYSVLDTGPMIQGRKLDLYMWSCPEATNFGRQKVRVTVLRRGWVEGNTRR